MQTACEAYVKGLLPTGNGYPQYVPEPNASLPEECQRRGILEGDVGILNQDGTWDYLFNVTKPSDLRINAGRTPPDFEWTPIDEEYDISTTPNFFKSGEHVASTSMTTTTLVADISTADNSGASSIGTRLQYKCSVSKGAMADFPEGCDRRDLLNKEKLRNLALRCGTSWYKHANGERFGRNAPNGSLYVVTGCDKTNTWRLASWSCGCKRGDISLTVTPTPSEGGASFSYSHENCTSATTGIRTGPSHTSGKNQCMFLRGFKVALREDPMSRVLGSVVLTSVLGARSNQIIPRWNGGNIPRPYVDNRRWPSSSPSGSSSSGSNSDSLSRNSPLPSDISDSSEPEDESDDISTGNYSVEMLPRSKPYHPSNLVIGWLLDTVPDAQVALVDDEVWMSVLKQDETEMPDETELLRRISEVYEPRIESGGAFLAPSDGDLDAPLSPQKKIVPSSSVGLLPSPDGCTSSERSYRNSLNAPCQDFRSLSATNNASDQPDHLSCEQQNAHRATQDTSDAGQPQPMVKINDYDDNGFMSGLLNYHLYTSFEDELAASFYGSADSANLTNTNHDSNHSLSSPKTYFSDNGPQSKDHTEFSFEYLDESSLPPPMEDSFDLSSSSSVSSYIANAGLSQSSYPPSSFYKANASPSSAFNVEGIENRESTFTTRSKSQRHRDARIGIKVHPCMIEGCDRSFLSVADRRRHENTHETTSQVHQQAIPEDNRQFIR